MSEFIDHNDKTISLNHNYRGNRSGIKHFINPRLNSHLANPDIINESQSRRGSKHRCLKSVTALLLMSTAVWGYGHKPSYGVEVILSPGTTTEIKDLEAAYGTSNLNLLGRGGSLLYGSGSYDTSIYPETLTELIVNGGDRALNRYRMTGSGYYGNGNGSFVKTGTGTLVAPQDFLGGGIDVQQGVLELVQYSFGRYPSLPSDYTGYVKLNVARDAIVRSYTMDPFRAHSAGQVNLFISELTGEGTLEFVYSGDETSSDSKYNLYLAPAQDTEFAGVMTTVGDGEVIAPINIVKRGSFTQTFSKNNGDFPASILIEGGTVKVGHKNALGSAAVSTKQGTSGQITTRGGGIGFSKSMDFDLNINSEAVTPLGVDGADSVVNYNGEITASTTGKFLDYQGPGRFVVTRDQPAMTAGIKVRDGRFEVMGNMEKSAISVSGGSFGGSGTVMSLEIVSGGALMPSSPGNFYTFNVTNNVTFADGSKYIVHINPEGQTSLLNVGDTIDIIDIDGYVGLEVMGADGEYANIDYTIATAANGVSGTFASVETNDSNLTASVKYEANDIILTADGRVGAKVDPPKPDPGTGTPDTGNPDTGTPDTGNPDTGNPDTGNPDTGNPDTGNPDTGNPDTGNPDTGNPDTGTPDTGNPDTGNPDTGTPDTGNPDTGNPDTGNPDTGNPDTGNPDTGTPDTGNPDTGTPDTGNPDNDNSDTDNKGTPDTDNPDTDNPDTDNPDTDNPGTGLASNGGDTGDNAINGVKDSLNSLRDLLNDGNGLKPDGTPLTGKELGEIASLLLAYDKIIDPDQQKLALKALSGEAGATMATLAINNSEKIIRTINNRLLDRGTFDGTPLAYTSEANFIEGESLDLIAEGGGSITSMTDMLPADMGQTLIKDDMPDNRILYSVWASAVGGQSSQDDIQDKYGFKTTYYGLNVGIDREIRSGFTIGMVASYIKSDFKMEKLTSKGDVDSYGASAYARYSGNNSWGNFGLGYRYDSIESQRGISLPGYGAIAKGKTSSKGVLGFLQGGYDIHLNDKLVLSPYAGLDFSTASIDDYTETGAGAANLVVRANDLKSLKTRVGGILASNMSMGSVKLQTALSLGWSHELGDVEVVSSNRLLYVDNVFKVSGVKSGRDRFEVGFKASAVLKQDVTAYIGYDGSFGRKWHDNSALAGISIKW